MAKITDPQCIAAWRELIGKFNKLVESFPPASKVQKELAALKEEAEKSIFLKIRQKEAIIARCDNYLNGTYGNTKTKENLGYAEKS